jgi:RNA polymerase sigma-70 factor (ECF subfamily)
VIVLRELEGMSYEELAEALGVPRGTVESRLHRARAELKEGLRRYWT